MPRRRMQRVVFQPRTYQGLLNGLNQMVNAISPTLGPRPRVVAMDSLTFGSKTPELFDNGGTIARRIIQIADRDADMGAMFLREVLWRLQEQVGDGTATAAILFHAVYAGGVRCITAGANGTLLRKYLREGLQLIMDELKLQTIQITGKEKLARVAESICYDTEMSRLMGEIFDIVGEYGRVEIRSSYSRDLKREYVEGMYWDWGVHTTSLLQNGSGKRMELENPAILISDLEINDPTQLFPPIALAIHSNIPTLMIIANHLSEKVIGFLNLNSKHEKIKIVAVKTPGWDNEQKSAALIDLSVLTGGRPFITAAGENFNHIQESDFGKARRAWADVTNFGLIGGRGNPKELRKHIATLRSSFSHCDDLIAKGLLRDRIGKLMGGSATLWVGGITEQNAKDRAEVAERTSAAMRGAMMGGVMPGGGTALLATRAALQRKLKESVQVEERAAYQILLEAVGKPFSTLVKNAGYDPGYILAEIEQAGTGYGFDVNSGEVVNMSQAGVFDPANVQRAAIYNGIESAALALTIDVLVHHRKPEKAELPQPVKAKQI
jgi:chaperonin GroEL